MSETKDKGRLRPWMIAAGAAALLLGLFVAWRAESNGPRLIFIGVDGVSRETAQGLFDEGKLPVLGKLIRHGALVGVSAPASDDEGAFWKAALGADKGRTLPEAVEASGLKSATLGLGDGNTLPRVSFAVLGQVQFGVPGNDGGFDYLTRIPGVSHPEGLFKELLPALTDPASIPRSVYEVLLPMNDQDWEDFEKLTPGEREDKFSAAKDAIATDYNEARAAKRLVEGRAPAALFVHFGGGGILAEGIDFQDPGFSKTLMQLVNLAFYEELRKSYLVLVDRLTGELLEDAGPETVVVIVSSPGRGSPMVEDEGESKPEPMGFVIVAGPGAGKEPAGDSIPADQISALVLGRLGLKVAE